MKKLFIFLALFSFMNVHGYDLMYDDIYYNVVSLEDKTCKVTSAPDSGHYKGEITIPSTIEINGHSLTVIGIESYAFYDSNELTRIILPSTLSFIEDRAFYNCPALLSITVSEENPFLCSIEDVLYDKEITKLIVCPSSLDKDIFFMPNTVTRLLPFAFQGSKLKEIILSENLEEIPMGLFNDSFIENVTIPASVQWIDETALYQCDSLKSLSIEDSEQPLSFYINENIELRDLIMNLEYQRNYDYNKKTIKELYVGRNINMWALLPIGKSLKTVTLGEQVTDIGDYAFMYCDSLENVIISNNLSFQS